MLSLPCFHYRFTPRWQMTVLTLCAFILFSTLGYWQLSRAAEKKQIAEAQLIATTRPPLQWAPGFALPKPFETLRLRGTFLNNHFLLDNQIYNHQIGYHVLTPFVLNTGDCILVNRGWVPAGSTRTTLPTVSQPAAPLDLSGEAYYPSDKQWVLGQEVEEHGTITVIERIHFPTLQALLHDKMYPFIVRLEPQAPHGFIREWKGTYLTPERHYGYALQWFLMGVVCLILFIALNLKKENCS